MSERDRAIAAIAERQHSVFSGAQAVSVGFNYPAIHRRVASGTWRRLHDGVYSIVGAVLSHRSYVLAAVLAATDSCASHRTAASLHGLDGFVADRKIEVMVFDRRGLHLPSIILHRPRVWIDADRTEVDRIPITSTCRTLFDLAAVRVGRRLEIAFDDALRQGLTTLDELQRRVDLVSKPGVRGVRKIALLVADRKRKGMTDSELETAFRRAVEEAGLPLPVPQYEVRRDDGTFVARVDFAYPSTRLAIELDSWKHHGDRSAFEGDRVRQNELVLAGWTPARFTDRDLKSRRAWLVSVVQRHLLARVADSGPA